MLASISGLLRERGSKVSCQAATLLRATSAPVTLASHASITVSKWLFMFESELMLLISVCLFFFLTIIMCNLLFQWLARCILHYGRQYHE